MADETPKAPAAPAVPPNPYAVDTIKVTYKEGGKGAGPVEINAADFDPKLHKKVEEKAGQHGAEKAPPHK